MPKFNFSLKALSLYLCFSFFGLFVYSQTDNDYYKFVDSADIHIDISSEKALSFLQAIPKPIENYISGRVAEYYALKALVHDDFKEYTKYHQCAILAIRYAEKEDDFCIAGEASIGLYSNLYFIGNYDAASKYLKKAKEYYKKCDNEYGLIEVKQVEAYAKFLDGDYNACNDFLLSELENYKGIKDDAYYYMFALYMLTSNYIYLDDLKNANKYFGDFKKLKTNSTVTKFNYFSFEGAIRTCYADVFLKQQQVDSTRFHLKKSSKLVSYMSEDALRDYYRLFADVYKYEGNIEKTEIYIDSLVLLQNKLHSNTIEASFGVNELLIKAENELITQNKKKTFYNFFIGFIVIILLMLSLLFLFSYKKQKVKLVTHSREKDTSFFYLKTNNEQLATKVYGLEGYIKDLKKEVKEISRTECVDIQKVKIKNLYKNLHINSSTLLYKSENHLDLVNELNIDFFTQIEEKYPQLNKSEIIICYYLFMGFTNKEIAVFLNATVRSVESKRYRISKKINLVNKDIQLLDFLQASFSSALSRTIV
ncbi:hypothetical protein [uncultured Algibacter sp.]|uniref:helix-turn-helix transcriptional regulator n=1 Tax=uncultured Algibacter sp. TaxID=298659 RepID=UPI00261E54CA|nr:hypothetical protein [uncultured Algibacter sp.]